MNVKQVIIIRKDLKMSKGKLAVQAAHAAVLGSISVINSDQTIFAAWIAAGMTKICVYVNSEKEMMDLYSRFINSGIPTVYVTDAGKTEFNGVPTRTCIAVGPWDNLLIDKFTKTLQLVKDE